MSDGTPKDAAAIWKDQPKEKIAVNLEQIVNRRAGELHSSTRSEILMSIGAALLFVAVMGWRFAPHLDTVQAAGFGAIVLWVAICLYRFRGQIRGGGPPPPDAAAASGVEHYRKELQLRRDHLRNAWLWHGPLFLACVLLIAVLSGTTLFAFHSLWNVLPLLVLLAVWTGFGLRRRYRLARELQREIDEIGR